MSGFDHCFSTLGCSELSLHQVADLAGRNGIETVELRALSGTLDLPAALAAEFGAPDGLAAFLTQRKLRVAALNTSVRLFDGADLSAIEPFVAWAEAAGADHLRVFDGGGRLSRAALDRAADWLEAWQADRRSRGLKVDLMIETHDALADYGQLVAFVERVPAARILWDSHHTWARGADMEALWHRIAKSVVHVHVKDSKPDGDGHRRYVLPGRGDFPMPSLLALLRSSGRRIPLSLEWERHWHPELSPLEEALTAARAWWGQEDFRCA
ncbi:sugar phosphate isomerase/epimerase [Nitratireductor sp. ZSWI3]|uniref:sugar phosphate isomerase/epimerase family protein n=1 Tax=Nitratireductor sp. ZSWI3 TaxID=2966359 RepID=UPI0021504DC0|nr:sugar phosphate isomerase/epimerase [Nitratireductor sp. ZSWI3]MCR4265422.1 sugar phosphate isomerase/epimerase [Nitratireductor sp. ZSWI3]